MMKPRYILFFILISVNLLCSQVTKKGPVTASVDETLKTFLENKDLKNASVGFYAVNLKTGSIIAEHNSHASLVPASVLKIITTAATIELAGPDHRFKTILKYSGTIDNEGTLQGNIYIEGGGDPTLGSAYFYKDVNSFIAEWKAAIMSAGIKKINGAIISDASLFTEEVPLTWIWGDIGNYYGAYAHSLSVYDNSYTIDFETGKSGSAARIKKVTPEITGLTFTNEVIASSEAGDNTFILGNPTSNERVITGTLPANRTSFNVKGSIPDPALLAAFKLTESLKNAGILISGQPKVIKDKSNAPAETKWLDTLFSPALSEIIRFTNVKSINTYAESLLLHTSLLQGKHADIQTAAKALKEFWKQKGIETEGMFLEDGSGLSRANGITARQLTQVLQYMSVSKNFDAFYKSLPIAGESGSLANLCKGTPAEGNLRAKSGYMERVRSYSGYVKNTKGEMVAFTFIVNNFEGTPSGVKGKMEKVLVALAESN